jgi:uncharacterized membrane protein YoaK (UPF0700 family)
MTTLKTLLIAFVLSVASFSIAQQDDSRRIDILEFKVTSLENQVSDLRNSSSQIITMTLKLEQLRTDLNEYVASQEKQNNRLWQTFVVPIVGFILTGIFLPRLVAKQVDNHIRRES